MGRMLACFITFYFVVLHLKQSWLAFQCLAKVRTHLKGSRSLSDSESNSQRVFLRCKDHSDSSVAKAGAQRAHCSLK